MSQRRTLEAMLLAAGMVASAWVLGYYLLQFKQADRVVEVKGLAEREMPADTAIWPIAFSGADNDLTSLYRTLQEKNGQIVVFLQSRGFKPEEISVSAPSITDRQAQDYGNAQLAERLRYSGKSTVTVYTRQVQRVRDAMAQLGELGKQGIALSAEQYENRSQFLFTGLNKLKPSMIEEATKNARVAADKFANDSDSRLGKIRRANQGQFTIEDRDASTPYIKKVRVVSSVEYSLVD
jgi:hypothetical protein